MRARPDVLIIGAGVVGLTAAVCLAETGMTVRVRTRHQPEQTTSWAAGAIWAPYLVNDDRVLRWSDASRSTLDDLAGLKATGVRSVHGMEASRDVITPPRWAEGLPGFRTCDPHELPEGFASGWWYTAPVVDMPVYLAYLKARLEEAGGVIEFGTIASLADATAEESIIVNCTGVAARELVPDPTVIPNRGQLVVVDNPGVGWFFVEHEEVPAPTYFLPHGHDRMVLGGSTEPGRSDLDPDLEVSKEIQRRCAIVEPLLAQATAQEHRVGLRPYRPQVRLERVDVGRRQVIHNYGHGGSGVTLSWGCALEVVELIRRL